LTFWWDGRSEIRVWPSNRERKFRSDNAALIGCVFSLQNMIRESGIPSGLEIGWRSLLFAPPILSQRVFDVWLHNRCPMGGPVVTHHSGRRANLVGSQSGRHGKGLNCG
jgi:hypothetical protein